jgi:hypothetical protein
VVVERLDYFDNVRRVFSYFVLQSFMPLTDHRSTIAVHAVGADSSRVEWSSVFTPVGLSDEEAIKLIYDFYTEGLKGLRKALEA